MRKLLWTLLIIFILGAVGIGYFFITSGSGYLTDQLVAAAIKAEKSDHTALAERLYRQALNFNDCDIEARTQLAALYESQERYSAAEALLLKGIEIFPSGTELYIKLSALYIRMGHAEQAANILDCVENPYVSIALSQKRPSVQVILPGGRYAEGTSFTLEPTEEKRYYYELDGHWELYTEPIPLTAGSQTVRVIAVNSEDVPSSVRSYNYTLLPKSQATYQEIGTVRCPYCGETFRVP